MNISSNFQRIDIYKAIVFVVLLTVLFAAALITGGAANEQADAVSGSGQETVQASTEDDQSAQGTTPPEQEDIEDTGPPPERGEAVQVPDLPESDVVLKYSRTEGLLLAPDGTAVYGLSLDKTVWIPIVPEELANELGTPAPQTDENGYWIVISVDGQEQYRWNEATLTWEMVVVASSLPGTEQADQETETQPTEAQSTVEATAEAAATETPPTAETGEEESQAPSGSEIPRLPVPTPTPGLPKTYRLNSGEFVYCISRRFDINPNQVLALNGMQYSTVVFSGMTLKIPQTGDPFPGRRALQQHPDTYVVKKGDTIYSIACKYGDVDPYAIAYANNLSKPYRLTPGQELYIP